MRSFSNKIFLAVLSAAWTTNRSRVLAQQEDALEYGVDVSFPMHYAEVLDAEHNPLGDRQSFYNDFLDGCVEHFGKKGQRCVQTEADRIEMSLRQPQSMQVRSLLVDSKAMTDGKSLVCCDLERVDKDCVA